MADPNSLLREHRTTTAWRAAALLAGLAALAGALLAGPTVLGLTLALESAVLVVLALAGRLPRRLPADRRLLRSRAPLVGDPVSRRVAGVVVSALTLIGLVLRLVGLGTDLWLDEIVTVREYATLSPTQIMQTYGAANNHLLHSLLVHLSTSVLGFGERAIRVPVLVAGTLTIPATYWLARRTQARLPALAGAAVVAVAYQHVFFSQNARGYALWMLFAILSAGLLVDALRLDRARSWWLYVLTAVLCVASVPTGAFVVAGQALVVVALIARRAARGDRIAGPVARVVAAFGVVSLLTVQVYAGVIGQASGVARAAWQSGEAGFEPLSRAFLAEVGRSAGVGQSRPLALGVLVLAALGAVGAVSLARRDAALLAMLVLGPALHVLYAAVEGLVFSPRFLVLWLFPAILIATETLDVAGRALARRRAARARELVVVVGALVLCLAVAWPSRALLGEPKQRYREALALAERVRGDGLVVAVYTAEAGVRWYGAERPSGTRLVEGETFAVARTAERLRAVVDEADGRRVVLVTTFERGLGEGRPRLDQAVRAGWRPARTFEGAVPGGDVTVWIPADGSGPVEYAG